MAIAIDVPNRTLNEDVIFPPSLQTECYIIVDQTRGSLSKNPRLKVARSIRIKQYLIKVSFSIRQFAPPDCK